MATNPIGKTVNILFVQQRSKDFFIKVTVLDFITILKLLECVPHDAFHFSCSQTTR